MNSKCPDTADMFEDGESHSHIPQKQQSPLEEVGKVANESVNEQSIIDALENQTVALLHTNPIYIAMVEAYGGCPIEIRRSIIEDATPYGESPDTLNGLAVFDLYNEHLQPTGAVFTNPTVDGFKDIVFGHGGIYFNRDKINQLPLIVTDDFHIAFKSGYPVYAPYQNGWEIKPHTLKALLKAHPDLCVIAPVHQKDDIQRRYTDLNVKMGFIDEPCNITMSKDELDGMIKTAVEQAKAPPKGHLAKPFRWGEGEFQLLNDGLYYLETDSKGNQYKRYISSPIQVIAQTRDTTNNAWGRLLKWSDADGVEHKQAVSMELFQSDGVDLRKALAYQGAVIAPDGKARNLFQSYLMSYPTTQRALCVDRVGWHDNVFVLPHCEIGQHKDGDIIVYQATQGLDSRYQSKGTLAQWRDAVSIPSQSHSRLVTALSAGFTGQLLTPLEQQNGAGIHYKGKSSKGKTTALFVGCSVWGKPSNFYRSWKSTGNALEHTAYMHNDGFLALDEIGEITNPKELGNIAYMLANGKGKARMTKQITNKPTFDWKIIFLSTGEKSLKDIMQECGQQAKLGQEIRLLDVDIDQSEYGVFDQLDFADDGAKQSKQLVEYANQYYGTAGIAWLEHLASDKANLIDQAKQLLGQYHTTLIEQHKQGHIVRVANAFALIATAGELATQAGITGWQTGTAFNAVQKVFSQWLNDFEYIGDYEDREILAQVKAFFEAYGSSRFENLTIIRHPDGEIIRPRIHNRVGYYDDENKRYLVFSEQFKGEICAGLNHKNVAKALKKHGWIECNANENMKSVRIPDSDKPQRMYVFNQKLWES